VAEQTAVEVAPENAVAPRREGDEERAAAPGVTGLAGGGETLRIGDPIPGDAVADGDSPPVPIEARETLGELLVHLISL
jgi:hypothetical protein